MTQHDPQILKVGEYVLKSKEPSKKPTKRVKIANSTWKEVLDLCDRKCEYNMEGTQYGLRDGDIDPVGGGTVKLTADHKNPHSVDPQIDPKINPNGKRFVNVIKKNFWDEDGKLNVIAILQSASRQVKEAFEWLKTYFNDKLNTVK